MSLDDFSSFSRERYNPHSECLFLTQEGDCFYESISNLERGFRDALKGGFRKFFYSYRYKRHCKDDIIFVAKYDNGKIEFNELQDYSQSYSNFEDYQEKSDARCQFLRDSKEAEWYFYSHAYQIGESIDKTTKFFKYVCGDSKPLKKFFGAIFNSYFGYSTNKYICDYFAHCFCGWEKLHEFYALTLKCDAKLLSSLIEVFTPFEFNKALSGDNTIVELLNVAMEWDKDLDDIWKTIFDGSVKATRSYLVEELKKLKNK